MITKDNLKEYFTSIHAIKDLPNELIFNFSDIEDFIEFYDEDDDCRSCIDVYLTKLNQFLHKHKHNYAFENGELIKSNYDIPKELTPIPVLPKFKPEAENKNKATKAKAEPKPKAVKNKKLKYKLAQRLYWWDNDGTLRTEKINKITFTEAGLPRYHVVGWIYNESDIEDGIKNKTMFFKRPANPVEKLPVDVSFIKRYLGMNGKVKTKEQVYTLLRSLQKAITERQINKDSAYSNQIEQIQDQLIKAVDTMGASAVIEIAPSVIEKYIDIVSSFEAMLSVTYLKQYISLNGKSGIKEKAKQLADKIRKAVDSKRITKADRYATNLETAFNNLIKATDAIFSIEQSELSGLQGIDGADGLGFIAPIITGIAANVIANQINKNIDNKPKVINSLELAGMEFETLPLTGQYKELIGIPSKNFSAMIYGKPGSGKTTFCIQFAKYLAEYHNLKVLFATIEEGINHTAAEKLNRLSAAHANLSIADHMPKNLNSFDVVFVDSVNSFRYSTEDLQALRNHNPNTVFISIFQSTKDGKFKGSQEYEHDVDVVIKAENGTITTVGCKNRFGVGGEIKVW